MTLEEFKDIAVDRIVELEEILGRELLQTLVLRDPENPEFEVYISNDTFEGVIEAIARAESRDAI